MPVAVTTPPEQPASPPSTTNPGVSTELVVDAMIRLSGANLAWG